MKQISEIPTLGALHFTQGFAVDDLLSEIAAKLEACGYRVAGYLQVEDSDGESCCAVTRLAPVHSGEALQISQSLGAGSSGCRLDPQALTEIVGDFLEEVKPGVDLVIVNRFAKAETDGHGFRPVIEQAVTQGIPVLTAVRPPYEEGWKAFAKSFCIDFPAEVKPVLAWFRQLQETKTDMAL